ncbi:MAG: hypothetical protein ACJ798_11720 [Phenylobacterium sp.]
MEQLIEVTHVNGAWSLWAAGPLEPTLFLSGGQAEQAARRLACGFAIAGCDAVVHIHDIQNLLIGDHRYFAGESSSFPSS